MRLRQKQDGLRQGLISPSKRQMQRPVPDEAVLDDAAAAEPGPQPERREPSVPDPGLRDLTFADWKAIVMRAFKEFMADNAMMLASALAYSTFFAIPAVIIVATGLFTLIASPQDITNFMQHITFIPADAKSLLQSSLTRASNNPGSSLVMTILGFVLAVWSVTGAMNSYMTALNLAYDRQDKRSFVTKRVVALKMAAVMGVAFLLVAVLTIFGPVIERAIASRIGPAGGVLDILWWVAQWPILLAGLLVAFATLLYLGPDVEHRKWQFLTPGSLVAAVLWIAASALFAVYTATFASYNKTWGSLAAVIVMLTWLWITGMALLLGAEINAETERSRRLREA
jgi:membrane protein